MASKVQSPGPSADIPPVTRQARPKKAATEIASKQANIGRAGSAGGIVLEKEIKDKPAGSSTPKPAPTKTPATEPTPSSANKTRRKPRKLNKDPTPASDKVASPAKSPPVPTTDTAATTELEALKSRVRGLEAKVEQLYSTNGDTKTRSPRRRGKGRKTSSATQVPTLSSTAANPNPHDEADEEEADEELVRLEGELEVARQDLEAFRPRTRRTKSQETTAGINDDDIEEIPRSSAGAGADETRQVTLSGSYRIPLPTSVSLDDVKSIQSGVAAAQNVARSFLEQRRVQQAQSQSTSTPSASGNTQTKATPKSTLAARAKKPATPRLSSSMEVAVATGEDGEKQSWGEWIGGYSMAISRAVKSIEHEAGVDSQRGGGGVRSGGAGGGKRGVRKGGGGGGKRPVVKATLSGEQVEGLMR